MFIFDFVTSMVLEEALDWFYQKIITFFCGLFGFMNGMGLELLDLPWVSAVVLFFSKLGWALYVVGLVVALFEVAIEYQNGRGSFRDYFLNMLKGFFAVSLFTVLPINLYRAAIGWQKLFVKGLGNLADADDIGVTAVDVLKHVTQAPLSPGTPIDVGDSLLMTVIVLAFGYAVLKVFFANLKRGGILVTQIAVGALYMFSVPRGILDPFRTWMKTVIGLCLTAFLQSVILTAGLVVFREHIILGLGIMLSASEVPRICGQFGLDTGTKANLMGSLYAAQSAINISRTISMIAK
ncbi:MAG: hypothetical protein IKN45_09285 [Lachnospiraceae bacterium]|nr:hypothetical protein [Lachnospiraceae bacterium]